MTKPKGPSRRLGFRDGNDDPALAPYVRSADEVREFSRWVFLQAVQREVPEVLRTLSVVRPTLLPGGFSDDGRPDEEDLERWAARWNLRAPWCLAYARGTWRAWRLGVPRDYWFDRDDLGDELISEDDKPASAPRPLKNAEHFRWLARRACLGQTWARLGQEARQTRATVSGACVALAKLIELPIAGRSGRPKSIR